MPTLEDARSKFRKGFKPIKDTPDPFGDQTKIRGDAKELVDELDELEDALEGEPTKEVVAPTMSGLIKGLRKRKAATPPSGGAPRINKWKYEPEGLNDAVIGFGIFNGKRISAMSRNAAPVKDRSGKVRRGRGYLGWIRENCGDPALVALADHWLNMSRT